MDQIKLLTNVCLASGNVKAEKNRQKKHEQRGLPNHDYPVFFGW